MKIPIHFHPGSVFLVLLAAIFFCGCKTAGSKQSVASAESQTAATGQVIVVPVLILSSPDDNSPGDRRNTPPQTDPHDPSIQAGRSGQTGVPVKL